MQLSQSHSARGSNTFPLKRGVSRLARKPSKMQPRRVNPAWGTFELFGSDAHRVTPSAEKFCVPQKKPKADASMQRLISIFVLRALASKGNGGHSSQQTHTFK
jgi:hypothetical protein